MNGDAPKPGTYRYVVVLRTVSAIFSAFQKSSIEILNLVRLVDIRRVSRDNYKL